LGFIAATVKEQLLVTKGYICKSTWETIQHYTLNTNYSKGTLETIQNYTLNTNYSKSTWENI
jgi:hypothetical protein